MAIHPFAIKNSHGGHLIFWVVFLPLLSIIFLPLLMPNQNIDPKEVRMVQELGVDIGKLTADANKTFSNYVISTGLMGATEDVFSPKSGTLGAKSGFAFNWVRGIWLMIYKAIWRSHALWGLFLMPMLFICIPAIIDGFCMRARKKYQFENFNPIFFYSSMHMAAMVVGLFVFLPFTPITLTSNLLALMLVMLGFAVWTAASNLLTGSN